MKISSFVVLGDIMIDEYVFGDVTRISPEAPVPILNINKREYFLGGAGNVFTSIQLLESKSTLIGIVNKKEDLNFLSERYRTRIDMIESLTRPTTLKSRFISNNQQLLRVDREETRNIESLEIEEVMEKIDRNSPSTIIISDYNKGVISKNLISHIVKYSRKNNTKTIVDPKGLDYLKYQGVYCLKPNLKEFEGFVGKKIISENDLIREGREFLKKMDLELLIITLSSNGIVAFDKKGFCIGETKKSEIFDVTGAGDTVAALSAFGIDNNWEMKKIVQLSNAAGSLAVSRFGTHSYNLQEIEKHYKNNQNEFRIRNSGTF